MRSSIIYALALFLLASCGNRYFNQSNVFIGTYRVMDQMIPYPFLFQEKNDSVFLFNSTGQLIDKIESTGLKNSNEFKFNHNYLKIIKKKEDSFFVYDALDSLNFKPLEGGSINFKAGAKFEKISPAQKLDIDRLSTEIENCIWSYNLIEDENSNPNEDLEIKQLLYFKNDSLTTITNYYYQGIKTISEHETKAYTILQLDQNSFLSFQKENDNPQTIYQIIKYNSNKIELKDFSSRVAKPIIFNKSSISVENYTDLLKNTTQYSNCFDGYQGEYYFGDDVTFNKGNKYIIDYVNIEAPNIDTESGYIIIHFNINCKGDVGKFGLIQMNRDFKKTAFTKEIVNHLINKVSQLEDFPSSLSSLEWIYHKDVHGFLMFKLEKGKIVDLCP